VLAGDLPPAAPAPPAALPATCSLRRAAAARRPQPLEVIVALGTRLPGAARSRAATTGGARPAAICGLRRGSSGVLPCLDPADSPPKRARSATAGVAPVGDGDADGGDAPS
jgi:hypothetical protein